MVDGWSYLDGRNWRCGDDIGDVLVGLVDVMQHEGERGDPAHDGRHHGLGVRNGFHEQSPPPVTKEIGLDD